MYQVVDNRSTGKTSRLMLWAKQNDVAFVCSNPLAMEQKALSYGIVGLQFYSYWDLYKNNIPEDQKFVIDELGRYVSAISNGRLSGYSLSIDE